jgi:putative membrane-bound dehydrogenase-like protein
MSQSAWKVLCCAMVALMGVAAAGGSATGAEGLDPLNVYIRAQEATHGPKAHNYPAFLERWLPMLRERGIEADGSLQFPSAKRLEKADVMILYCQNAVQNQKQRQLLSRFTERGGDLVVLHSAVTSDKPGWYKKITGGAFVHDQSKWSVNKKQGVYFQDKSHPITKGVSNFDLPNEEVYWKLDLHEDIHTLATSYHDIRVIAPQMWTFAGDNHRAFTWISAGHRHTSFNRIHCRALVLRGVAWAAGRPANVFLTAKERGSLKYPDGGPVAPNQAARTLNVHPKFNHQLTASEPMLANPIDVTFDGDGRAWVAETPEYPQVRNPEKPQDRVSILTDTDGDGRYDKKQVFYKGLELITSLALYRDGVIVAQAPHIYWLRDTNDDGKADEKQLVLTGFGTSDTHAVVNHLRWGMDGWIYATLGYSEGDLQNATGKKFGHFNSGVFRFRPDGSQAQQVSAKGGNTWGVTFTWDGEILWSQATSGRHLFHTVMPAWALSRGRVSAVKSYSIPLDKYIDLHPAMRDDRPAYVQVAPTGGFTAGSGCAIYGGGAWPEPFDKSVFVSDPTLWLTHRDTIQKTGLTYKAEVGRPKTEFLAGEDLWFCPVTQRVGPGGALYVVDFYNQAVSHNDIRLPGKLHGENNQAIRPDRARKFGRLWRIQHKQARSFNEPTLREAAGEELAQALDHPNRWRRMRAQRRLVEAGDELPAATVDSIKTMLRSSDSPQRAQIHALWTLDQLDKLSDAALARTIRGATAPVQRNALRVINNRHFAGQTIASAVRRAALDQVKADNPRVRLEALIALGSTEASDAAVERVIRQYESLNNRWLRSAALGVLNQAPEKALRAVFAPDRAKVSLELVDRLAKQVAEQVNAGGAGQWVVFVANQPAGTRQRQRAVMGALSSVWTNEKPPGWSEALGNAFETLLNTEDPELATAALPLATHWDRQDRLAGLIEQRIAKFSDLLQDRNRSVQARLRIARGLLSVRPLKPRLVDAVVQMLKQARQLNVKQKIVEALGDVDGERIGDRLVQLYPNVTPKLQATVFDQVVRRPGWSRQFLKAVEADRISLNMLGPTAMDRLRGHPSKGVAERAAEVFKQKRGATAASVENQMKRLLPKVSKPGDPARGKQLFSACAQCHRYKDRGSDLGPELTGVGAAGTRYLLLNTIAPNHAVAPNYVAYNVTTKDGKTYRGILARQTEQSVTLRNQSTTTKLKRSSIASIESTGDSLMPTGFAGLGAKNLRDLFAYLKQSTGKYQTVNLAQAFTTDTARGMWQSREAMDQRIKLKKFGIVRVEGIPFRVTRPGATASGDNALVLKGGSGYADTLPQSRTIETNVRAKKLHFLGGVGGWAYPWGNDEQKQAPAMKISVRYADGEKETLVLHNGEEFADYIARHDVPGSKYVAGLVEGGKQVRWFTEKLKKGGRITRLSFSSLDNHMAPCLLAVTAEAPNTNTNANARTETKADDY